MNFKSNRSLAMLLSAGVLLGSFTAPAQASIPHAYWQYQDSFVSAKESGNHAALIPVALQIEELMLAQSPSDSRTQILYNVYEALAISYEAYMDYDLAIWALEQQIVFARALGFTDAIILAEKRIQQINPLTEVYVLSQNMSTLPYYGAKYEPRAGAYFGRTQSSAGSVLPQESAVSVYVECFQQEISQFDYYISSLDTGSHLLQVCLNMPGEGTSMTGILDSSADAYLIRQLEYLSTFNSPVLLRVGGEMNVWTHGIDTETFKSAFIKVANLARQYAPNVAMVFSPNDISSWGVDVTDYYPGDAYVDWVGMSTYTQKYLDPANPYGSSDSDMMFYGTGDYADPIHALTEIVTLFGDRKPIIISESGSGYAHKTHNLNLYEFSMSQLATLFTYANMVYPQVKAIINFDANVSSDQYYFSMSANSDLFARYQSVISGNASLISSVQSQVSSAYVKAGSYNDQMTTLQFASHSAPVGQPTVEVRYVLDGTQVASSTAIPYNYDLPVGNLTEGTHSFSVYFSGDNGFNDEKHYTISKSGGNGVTISEGATDYVPPSVGTTPDVSVPDVSVPDVSVPDVSVPDVSVPEVTVPDANTTYSDIPSNHWAFPYVEFVHNNGILQGENRLFDGDGAALRGVIAQSFMNLSKGSPNSNLSASFSDVQGTSYQAGVNWCLENGIMSGLGDDLFGTLQDLEREQFAVTLAAYSKYMNQYQSPDPASLSSLNGYADGASISSWARESVAWAVENGLMAGFDNQLTPRATLTRAQVSAMLYSFVQMVSG